MNMPHLLENPRASDERAASKQPPQNSIVLAYFVHTPYTLTHANTLRYLRTKWNTRTHKYTHEHTIKNSDDLTRFEVLTTTSSELEKKTSHMWICRVRKDASGTLSWLFACPGVRFWLAFIIRLSLHTCVNTEQVENMIALYLLAQTRGEYTNSIFHIIELGCIRMYSNKCKLQTRVKLFLLLTCECSCWICEKHKHTSQSWSTVLHHLNIY